MRTVGQFSQLHWPDLTSANQAHRIVSASTKHCPEANNDL